MTTVLPPVPDTTGPPPDVALPALARARTDDDGPTRGDVLYRIYLGVIFGGLYGSALVHTLATIAVPPVTADDQLLVGLGSLLIPVVASWMGIGFGRIAGPVPVARPEASILLPTMVDRPAWLRPRLRRSYLAVVLGGVGLGLVATVLLALQRQVGLWGWLTLPSLVASASLLGAGLSAVTQTLPSRSTEARLIRLAPPVVGVALAVFVTAGPLDGLARRLGTDVTGVADVGPFDTAGGLVALVAAVAIAAAVVGWRSFSGVHDEELTARAGLHSGLAASARLGDLRGIASVRDPLARRRGRRSLPYPRRPAGAVWWRNLTALRDRPAPLGACAAGWAAAAWLVALPTDTPTVSQVVLRTALAVGALYLGIATLLEPLRREHDSPLAAELLPFGFAHLNWLHLRSAFVLATSIGLVVVPIVTALTAGTSLLAGSSFVLLGFVVFAAAAGVVAVGDRVRQPSSVGEIMASLPGGVGPEMVGIMLVGRLVWPLMAMLPVALLVAITLLSTPLGDAQGPVFAVGVAAGVVAVLMRVAGLAIWLREYERRLQDADVLPPSSAVAITWNRVRDRVMRRGHAGRHGVAADTDLS